MKNKQQILSKRPVGFPRKDTWVLRESEIPTAGKDELVIKNYFVSIDPAMRGWMNNTKSYIEPVELGDVMRAGTIGEVIESNNSKFTVGDMVTGWGGVQQYTLTNGKAYYKVDTSLAPATTYISTLGMPGMTAYFGILKVGKIKEEDVVVVSGAAGAVGSVVGQIAKIKGCKVVGIAGGFEKCEYLKNELGFDEVIDYKAGNLKKDLKIACPNGVDVYFDNVGGEILDTVLTRIRMHARIVICGAISQYNNEAKVKGPSNYLSLLVNRANMQGMVVMDYAKDYGNAAKEMGMWMAKGKLKSREDVFEGIENFYETFGRLFSGEKLGKLVLDVREK